MPIIENIKTVRFNDVDFTPLEGVKYRTDYVKIAKGISLGEYDEIAICRQLILTDLFFILYFVMGIEKANHAFVVRMCQEVEKGPQRDTVDVWARFHFKSTIITIAETLQYHLNPDHKGHCSCLLAYARPLSKKFLQTIKQLCETSDFLKACFPDILYENPETQSPKWSLDEGLIFKNANPGRKESTVEAAGLIEGMPIGRHYERLIFDDIETDDIKDSPDMLDKVFSKFEMSYGNLGNGLDSDIIRIIGTYYSHVGPITRIQGMVYPGTKDKIFQLRKVSGSHDGTMNGTPVLIDPKSWLKLKASRHFNSQQLCDPTPMGDRKLHGEHLKDVDPKDIPSSLHKFMLIDPAGDDESNTGSGDDWASLVTGVEGGPDEIGAHNIYILDAFVDKAGETEIVDILARMYLRNGLIMRTGYERNLNTTPGWLIHFINNLGAMGIKLSEDLLNLVRLKHGGRNKNIRVSSALQLPLLYGKIFISTSIPKVYRDKIRMELDQFPYCHVNALDALAYLYDVIDDPYIKQTIKAPRGGKKSNLLLFPQQNNYVPQGLGWMGG